MSNYPEPEVVGGKFQNLETFEITPQRKELLYVGNLPTSPDARLIYMSVGSAYKFWNIFRRTMVDEAVSAIEFYALCRSDHAEYGPSYSRHEPITYTPVYFNADGSVEVQVPWHDGCSIYNYKDFDEAIRNHSFRCLFECTPGFWVVSRQSLNTILPMLYAHRNELNAVIDMCEKACSAEDVSEFFRINVPEESTKKSGKFLFRDLTPKVNEEEKK